MIINIGNRTDIPAFFSDWFYNRIEAGSVCVRNPWFPEQVTRFSLDSEVVDFLLFCSKNPGPMLSRIDRLKGFHQFWQITITPYGRDIEPFVPEYSRVIETFCELSSIAGSKAVVWRYDPIIITEKYSLDFHLKSFQKMASMLEGKTEVCVISFVDLYKKTLRNFPGVREVSREEQSLLAREIVSIASDCGMRVKGCAESSDLERFGVDGSGCVVQKDLEALSGLSYLIPRRKPQREQCSCLLENEIGAYNSCPHGCLYCYANYSREEVRRNFRNHDPESPLLIGHLEEGDTVKEARCESYLDRQISLF